MENVVINQLKTISKEFNLISANLILQCMKILSIAFRITPLTIKSNPRFYKHIFYYGTLQKS